MRRVKQSLRYLSAHFNCQRMVDEYRTELYDPAHRAFQVLSDGHFQAVRERVPVERRGSGGVASSGGSPIAASARTRSLPGRTMALRAEVDMAGLKADDVRVEALVGRVGPEGELEEVQVLVLEPREQHESKVLFGRDIVPYATGRLGFSVRIVPTILTTL